MGNKNASPPKGPESVGAPKEEGMLLDGRVSTDEALTLSPEMLDSLQALEENDDYTLLPQSLHRIAEAYSLKEDYQWAIQFLQLEKLYHERLLSNLAALQDSWESLLGEKAESCLPPETDGISQKHFETLIHICRTHRRPSVGVDREKLTAALKDSQTKIETLQACHNKVWKPEATRCDEEEGQNPVSDSGLSSPQKIHDEEWEGGEEALEEGHEVEEEEHCEETPEDEEVKVEWPTGVPQASDKELAKLSHTEGSSSPDGLVSILKRRRASLDGLPPPSSTADKQSSKRKVRFSEPEDGVDQDEVGGDSCLILLLLCLVTVVISVGGTALYCTMVGTYSNICTDFSHNVDFYVSNVRGFFERLGQWLPLRT